ncbi:MAG: hypothetical protein EP297_06070 [Gammaproteobacteria bacterium]|nr:MAG: hypothetical protein EP297_06070 [Gammaproteobacteria bacterium]
MTHLIWPENRRLGVILYSLLSTFLLSCQSSPVSRHVYPQQGMPLNELIKAYGKPHEVSAEYGVEANRNVWNLSDARLATTSHRAPRYNAAVSGGQVVTTTSTSSLPEIQQIHCTLVVFTGPDSKVQDWETFGDGCRQILLNEL